MTEYITGELYKAMIINGSAAIENHKTEINELNVFPVPDGDTGTNMALTLSRGADAMSSDGSHKTVGKAAEAAAKGLMNGARGNSGVILSLLFRGVAERLRDLVTADAKEFSAALVCGVERAYNAVMKPTEGTILTVSRHAAHAAEARAEQTDDIEDVLEAALESGRVALANTVNQNPVLKKAGVIDSGGKGYIYILDAMLRALRGDIITAEGAGIVRDSADFTMFRTEDIKFTYCTEFTVSREGGRDINALRAFLDAHGDSVVVLDDEDIIKTHVHTNEPGAVLTEALTYGALIAVKVENMRQQHTETISAAAEKPVQTAAPAVPDKKYGLVAVCAGSGMEEIFRNLGADSIISGGQTMNPSTEDILVKINAVPAETVYVFPNNKNIVMAAQQCVPLSEKNVIIIPTQTMPQGITAMIAYDENAGADELTEMMTEAMKNVRTIQITHAARDSAFDGLNIKAGQYLALAESALVAVSEDFLYIAEAVADVLSLEPPEFLTVFIGEDADEHETEVLNTHLQDQFAETEITVLSGMQPVYRYVISAE